MFWKKAPKPEADIILVTDIDGNVCFRGNAAEFPLSESSIIKLSMEFYNDPSPCEIHRSAVRMRAFYEILEVCPAKEICTLNTLPDRVREFFSDLPGGYYVQR